MEVVKRGHIRNLKMTIKNSSLAYTLAKTTVQTPPKMRQQTEKDSKSQSRITMLSQRLTTATISEELAVVAAQAPTILTKCNLTELQAQN